ncbi:MAG: hypothetical protein QW797_02025, partial [Thermoproteota archaeon]
MFLGQPWLFQFVNRHLQVSKTTVFRGKPNLGLPLLKPENFVLKRLWRFSRTWFLGINLGRSLMEPVKSIENAAGF